MTSAPPGPLVFSTDAFDQRDRFDAWRETFALALARVDIGTPDPSRFHASATVHSFDVMRLIAFDLGPMTISRTADLVRDGDDGFSLVLCTSGAGHAVGPDGDGIPLSPGRAVLIPHYVQGGTVAYDDNTEISLVIPRDCLRQAIRDPDAAAGRVPSNPAALALLAAYLGLFADRREIVSPPLAGLVEGHVLDLLSLAFDPASDFARAGGNGGARGVMRQRLLAVIAERHREPDLDPGTVAAALGISLRSVHALLEATGETFSEHLREHRLQTALRMLRSPRHRDWRVVEIAFAAGFGDLSYFNRTFRRRFGDTPQAFRRTGSGEV
ncbi:MAG: helix-turn-helix transcriptional regulator [Bauldia sp.]|uniref:helix-turn-helix transcriptional regulator n=1 Tax=Bauldia sp. TaxID=2575872 RepID=UPI001D881EC9|nr:AraC family transcriptional regulator [Bauldia sp.]MCB1496890.1 helix-turn-helix transcriptional regulator [Bauldia sp.]